MATNKTRRTLGSLVTEEPPGEAPKSNPLPIPTMSAETRAFTGRTATPANGSLATHPTPKPGSSKADAKASTPEGKGISFLARPASLYDWLQDAVHEQKKKSKLLDRQKDLLRKWVMEGLQREFPHLKPADFNEDVILNPPD